MLLGAMATSFSKLARDWVKRGPASVSRFSVTRRSARLFCGAGQSVKVFIGRRRMSHKAS